MAIVLGEGLRDLDHVVSGGVAGLEVDDLVLAVIVDDCGRARRRREQVIAGPALDRHAARNCRDVVRAVGFGGVEELECVGRIVVFVLRRASLSVEVEQEDVLRTVGVVGDLLDLGTGAVVDVGQLAAVVVGDLGIVQRAVGVGPGKLDDMPGGIEVLMLCGVGLPLDVVAPIVRRAIGVGNVRGGFDAVGVGGRGAIAVDLRRHLAGQNALGVVPVRGFGPI